jgi:hypothetical protein
MLIVIRSAPGREKSRLHPEGIGQHLSHASGLLERVSKTIGAYQLGDKKAMLRLS